MLGWSYRISNFAIACGMLRNIYDAKCDIIRQDCPCAKWRAGVESPFAGLTSCTRHLARRRRGASLPGLRRVKNSLSYWLWAALPTIARLLALVAQLVEYAAPAPVVIVQDALGQRDDAEALPASRAKKVGLLLRIWWQSVGSNGRRGDQSWASWLLKRVWGCGA